MFLYRDKQNHYTPQQFELKININTLNHQEQSIGKYEDGVRKVPLEMSNGPVGNPKKERPKRNFVEDLKLTYFAQLLSGERFNREEVDVECDEEDDKEEDCEGGDEGIENGSDGEEDFTQVKFEHWTVMEDDVLDESFENSSDDEYLESEIPTLRGGVDSDEDQGTCVYVRLEEESQESD